MQKVITMAYFGYLFKCTFMIINVETASKNDIDTVPMYHVSTRRRLFL